MELIFLIVLYIHVSVAIFIIFISMLYCWIILLVRVKYPPSYKKKNKKKTLIGTSFKGVEYKLRGRIIKHNNGINVINY